MNQALASYQSVLIGDAVSQPVGFERRGRLGALVLVPAVLATLFSPPLVRGGTWTDVALSVLGWVALGIAFFLRLWAMLYIGGKKSRTLVAEGPYALCRHPLYLASFLILIALVLFLKSLSLMLAVALVAAIYLLWLLPSEERHLIECFGEQYQTYCRMTPRIWPRLSAVQRPGMREVKIASFIGEYSRCFGCMMIAAMTQVIGHLRIMPWWPAWLPFS